MAGLMVRGLQTLHFVHYYPSDEYGVTLDDWLYVRSQPLSKPEVRFLFRVLAYFRWVRAVLIYYR